MSKRCKLQKEYYKEFGNYKGSGKYTDHYVNWLESKVLAINYTRCCTELKDRETPTFRDWLRINCEPTRNTKMFKKGNRLMLNTELLEVYKKEYNL